MTPSGWHEDAGRRDAGHDEMQLRVWRSFNKAHSIKREVGSRGLLTYEKALVFVEYPFKVVGRGIAGFADIAVKYEAPGDGHSYYVFCELKPIISSVGALIRQCRATYLLAEASLRDRHSGHALPCDVFAFIYEDDPKAALLRELYPEVMALPREGAS